MHACTHTHAETHKNRHDRWTGWRDEMDGGRGWGLQRKRVRRLWGCALGLKQTQSEPLLYVDPSTQAFIYSAAYSTMLPFHLTIFNAKLIRRGTLIFMTHGVNETCRKFMFILHVQSNFSNSVLFPWHINDQHHKHALKSGKCMMKSTKDGYRFVSLTLHNTTNCLNDKWKGYVQEDVKTGRR